MVDRPFSPRLSLALDAARAFAACYVILHHLAQNQGWTAGAGVFLRFGQEAVIVFFLLSGMVIFANEKERAQNPSGYFLRRLRRIYPILLAAFALSAIVAFDNGQLAEQFSSRELLGNIFSLQDVNALKPGVFVSPFLRNTPLWSLSYEVFFYLIFPFVLRFFLANPKANHIIGAICCASYISYLLLPNHFSLVLAYFQIWWTGAMIANAYMSGHRNVLGMMPTISWLAVLCLIAAAAVLVVGYQGLGVYPFLMLRHFAFSLAMAVILFGPLGRIFLRIPQVAHAPITLVAGISYALYVLHYPLLINWHRAEGIAGMAVAGALLIILSYGTEKTMMRFIPRAPKG